MSQDAKTLLYWASNAASNVTDSNKDQAYCLVCARAWANYVIWQG